MSHVNPSTLERDLVAQLRESSADNARAMAATVVVVSSAEEATILDDLVDSLMGRRPARVLHLRGNAPGGFKTWSSARCSLDRQSRGVCFEDIFIETPDDSAYEGRIWGPLVIRELPALLIWTLGAGYLLSCGYDCGDRVDLTIIDGQRDIRSFGFSPKEYRDQVASVVDSIGALVDLSWERSLPIRHAAARLFDGPFADRLNSVERIRIQGFDPWTMSLLSGWIRDRLSFREEDLVFDIIPPKSEGEKQGIEFFLTGSPQSGSVEFIDPRHGQLQFFDGRSFDLSFSSSGFGSSEPGAILERLVDAPIADPLYRRAIEKAVV
jgi:hypothetical protein